MHAPAARLLGTVISERYRLEEVILESPVETLYRGSHTHTHQHLIVRLLHAGAAESPDVLARFEREGIAGACINHPNVAAARDLGALPDGSYFLVMEDLVGPTLRQVIRSGGVSLDRALHVVRQIALALDATHTIGVVHRALSPESVRLVTVGSETDVVKLVDFGSALLPPALVASAPQFEGRAERVAAPVAFAPHMRVYTAPEVAGGWPAGVRSDLFALGQIVAELVVGAPAQLVPGQPPPLLSGVRPVPQPLDALAASMLAQDPEQRISSAREVIFAIDAMMASPAETAVAAAKTSLPLEGTGIIAPAADHAGAPPPPKVSLRDLPQPIRIGVASAAAITAIIVLAVLLRPASIGAQGSLAGSSTISGNRPTAGGAAPGAAAGKSDKPAAAEPDQPSDDATERELRTQFAKDMRQNRLKDAVATLDRLVEANPRAAEDREVRSAIVSLSQKIMLVEGPEPDKMFDLLANRMDTIGADILYELVTTRGGSRAAKRADELLRDESVRDRGTEAMRMAYDFRMAKRCEDKIALFDRAKSEGDGRTLGQLQLINRSCGRRSNQCCLHNDPRLKETIEAIKARQ